MASQVFFFIVLLTNSREFMRRKKKVKSNIIKLDLVGRYFFQFSDLKYIINIKSIITL